MLDGVRMGGIPVGRESAVVLRRIWWRIWLWGDNKENWGNAAKKEGCVLCFFHSFYQVKRGNEWAKKGGRKDTERVGEGGNGVRGDAGVRRINVMDWFGVFFFTDGQRKSEQHEDWIKADSHQRGTDARVCTAAPWELMAQDSFQTTVALTDINGEWELTSCLKCV